MPGTVKLAWWDRRYLEKEENQLLFSSVASSLFLCKFLSLFPKISTALTVIQGASSAPDRGCYRDPQLVKLQGIRKSVSPDL